MICINKKLKKIDRFTNSFESMLNSTQLIVCNPNTIKYYIQWWHISVSHILHTRQISSGKPEIHTQVHQRNSNWKPVHIQNKPLGGWWGAWPPVINISAEVDVATMRRSGKRVNLIKVKGNLVPGRNFFLCLVSYAGTGLGSPAGGDCTNGHVNKISEGRRRINRSRWREIDGS